MNVMRHGELQNGEPGTGHILLVELFSKDIETLTDPVGGIVTEEFGRFLNNTKGWQADNSIFVSRDDVGVSHLYPEPIGLWVGAEGDLSFVVWRNDYLLAAHEVEHFPDLGRIVHRDPKDHLGRIGIRELWVTNLGALGRQALRQDLATQDQEDQATHA